MRGFHFYLELENKNRKAEKSLGTVVAVDVVNPHWYVADGNGKLTAMRSAVGAVQDYPNCPVCGTAVSYEYLAEKCRRISEAEARKIHPQLFVYLDESYD